MATRLEAVSLNEENKARGRDGLIDLISAYEPDGMDGDERHAFKDFIKLFYHSIPADELANSPAPRLRTVAESFWAFAEERKGPVSETTPKVRVFNPDYGDEIVNPCTVVEIVAHDMPFIVASILAEINERDLAISFLAHPVVTTCRDKDGRRVLAEEAVWSDRESMIHIEVALIANEAELREFHSRVVEILCHVVLSVGNWQDMNGRLQSAIEEMQDVASSLANEEVVEAVEFLKWLSEDHFLFFGARDYVIEGDGDKAALMPVESSNLGVMKDPEVLILRRRGDAEEGLAPFVRNFLNQPSAIVVAKSNTVSLVHRRAYMDYVGIKTYSADGVLTGERRFIGLFTAAAYNRSTRAIPYIRRKVQLALVETGFEQRSHDANAFLNVIENFPRDELFQIEVEQLSKTSVGILRLMERPRTKVFVRRDPFDRFVTALVYFPRDHFSTTLRAKVGDELAKLFHGRASAFYTQLGDNVLARVHYIIGRTPGTPDGGSDLDADRLVVETVRSWIDKFSDALQIQRQYGEAQRLFRRYREAFSEAYKEAFEADEAAQDIDAIEALDENAPVSVRVYRHDADAESILRLKIYHYGVSIPLSRSIPILENMGLRVLSEFSYKASPKAALGQNENEVEPRYIYDFLTEQDACNTLSLETLQEVFAPAFVAIWKEDAENDGFNRLIVSPGLSWRDVALLRACAKYRLQTGIAFSQAYMQEALSENAGIASNLIELFKMRHDPELPGAIEAREAASGAIRQSILRALAQVPSLDQDRIMRRILNLIEAMVRTNFFQLDELGQPKPYISFKLDAARIEELPDPRPVAEIFVYSPRVEGVHLRQGRIARGGLRWSDRREDFRTEILGLVKAQQVKNAVIVPSGAKGGFFPKQLPQGGSRSEIQEEAIEAYKIFVSGLLDLTDNLVLCDGETKNVVPDRVVCFDAPDPYLVVAADKGTASFSDIANSISKKYGFWLGDAFASGGSQGYDHKVMGITARGGWEAVKRHFRELGQDIQTTPFTAVGVGDMSGDVFGNGMLLSKHIRLIAAFDHRDIFIDPRPDEGSTWIERKRLFDLPRSSWDDFNRDLISEGGGVFSRSSKTIPVTKEIQDLLQLDVDTLPPNDLIKAILKTEADLLWFGGIGTYLKSREESHLDVGDRASDAIRIDVDELRVQVVGEGANLGCTQLGRVSFARKGGRINMDAVDNAAGVDCSDHEVNIKILLDSAMAAGKLAEADRNHLLEDMTSSVSELVLRNNYEQTLAITLVESTGHEDRDADGRVMRALERDGSLDRDLEFLPSDDDLAELAEAGLGLVRPELAVLMSYTKITLSESLLKSDVPDDPYLGKMLQNYFPRVLCEQFSEEIEHHRLRREIISTELANQIVNVGGITFIHRIQEMTGAEVAEIAKAFVIVRALFSLGPIRIRINALDNKVDAEVQSSMHRAVKSLVKQQAAWFLTGNRMGSIGETIDRYKTGIQAVHDAPRSIVSGVEVSEIEEAADGYIKKGVDEELAGEVAILMPMSASCDMVEVAERTKRQVNEVAEAYFSVGSELRLDRLRQDIRHVSAGEHWDRLAIKRIGTDMAHYQRKLVEFALVFDVSEDGAAGQVAQWLEKNDATIGRFKQLFGELEASGGINIAKLSLLSSQMRDLVNTLETQ
jgi:glutamate dehydrogenase